MNFYRRWGRWFLDFEFHLNVGRFPKPLPKTRLDEIRAEIERAVLDNPNGRGLRAWVNFAATGKTSSFNPADEFAPADIRPDPYTAMQDAWVQSQAAHPFQDPDALTGNITAPAGAQDFTVVPQEGGGGWGVVDVTRAAYVPNPVNQHTGD